MKKASVEQPITEKKEAQEIEAERLEKEHKDSILAANRERLKLAAEKYKKKKEAKLAANKQIANEAERLRKKHENNLLEANAAEKLRIEREQKEVRRMNYIRHASAHFFSGIRIKIHSRELCVILSIK